MLEIVAGGRRTDWVESTTFTVLRRISAKFTVLRRISGIGMVYHITMQNSMHRDTIHHLGLLSYQAERH
jgi:hypothetical protein